MFLLLRGMVSVLEFMLFVLKKIEQFLFLFRKSWQIGVHIAINEIPMPALLCSVSVFYAGRCGCVGCITASSFVIDLKWEYVFLL